MNIKKVSFKDVEGILCDTGRLLGIFLPKYGGRLVSLKDSSGREWLAQDKNTKYIHPRLGDSYVECEVSGADDMFPTIDPCVWGGKEYPCHGEVCRTEHTAKVNKDSLQMQYTSSKLGYSYKKTITKTADGKMSVEYSVKNTGKEAMPCFWALHLMFAAFEGGEIILPSDMDDKAEITFDDTKKYGVRGDVITVTGEHLRSKKPNGETYKFYYLSRLKTGICGYYDKRAKEGITVEFDSKKIPFLGIWMNNGGFKNMHSAAVEPCTMPFDTPLEAKKRGSFLSIEPGEEYSFKICLGLLEGDNLF